MHKIPNENEGIVDRKAYLNIYDVSIPVIEDLTI